MQRRLVNSYTLDTLQIFFAWDDDLYTHLKERGFGQAGFQRKTLPIIYSDNCQSTTSVVERRRKYVISPRYFGKTYEQLGWKPTDKETEPIIGSEKPRISAYLIDDVRLLEFRLEPQVNGKEEYHLEYSTMAAFGRLYTNWAIPMMTMKDFKHLISSLQQILEIPTSDVVDAQVHKESKQAQRELMFYVEVPIESYKFSIGEFGHAKEFLEANGVTGTLPSLVFRNESSYLEKMQPILKVGFVQTTGEQGFETRRPQIALKVAQPKMTMSLRGTKTKAKGLIAIEQRYENYFVVPTLAFATSSNAILNRYADR